MTEKTCPLWHGPCWAGWAQMITNNENNENVVGLGWVVVGRTVACHEPTLCRHQQHRQQQHHLATTCCRKLKCQQTLHLDSGIITSTSGPHIPTTPPPWEMVQVVSQLFSVVFKFFTPITYDWSEYDYDSVMWSSWYRCIRYFTFGAPSRTQWDVTLANQVLIAVWLLNCNLNWTLQQFQSHSLWLPPQSQWKPRELNGEQWPQCWGRLHPCSLTGWNISIIRDLSSLCNLSSRNCREVGKNET